MNNSDVRLRVVGTGKYLPKEIITTAQFTKSTLKIYDENDNIVGDKRCTEDDIFKVTGIRERRRARADEEPSDMGSEAASRALENAGVTAKDLVGIICATVTEECNFPNAAQKIQKRIGARNCFAKDVAFACAGFSEALVEANARVLRDPGLYLVVAAEKMSSMIDYEDINAHLFGDGAGAFVLAPTTEPVGIITGYSASDPFEGKTSWGFRNDSRIIRMPQGRRVMKAAINEMIEVSRKLKERAQWDAADVYIPHQANGRIIEGMKNRISAEGSKVYSNIEHYGNMSAATCPIAYHEAVEEGVIPDGSKVIITAYGLGESKAGVALIHG